MNIAGYDAILDKSDQKSPLTQNTITSREVIRAGYDTILDQSDQQNPVTQNTIFKILNTIYTIYDNYSTSNTYNSCLLYLQY